MIRMTRSIPSIVAACALAAAASASAGQLVVNPDGQAVDADISNAFAGVTLSAIGATTTSVYAAQTPLFASTGPDDREFGWLDGNSVNDFWIIGTFQATLTGSLASAVSIQVFPDNGKFVLTAFDSNNASLGSIDSDTDTSTGTTIGASNLEFKSISANGAASGDFNWLQWQHGSGDPALNGSLTRPGNLSDGFGEGTPGAGSQNGAHAGTLEVNDWVWGYQTTASSANSQLQALKQLQSIILPLFDGSAGSGADTIAVTGTGAAVGSWSGGAGMGIGAAAHTGAPV